MITASSGPPRLSATPERALPRRVQQSQPPLLVLLSALWALVLVCSMFAAAASGGSGSHEQSRETQSSPASSAHQREVHFRLRVIYSASTRSQELPVIDTVFCPPDDPTIDQTKCLGGAARRATVIKRLREEAPGEVLLVDAGYFMHGSLFFQAFMGATSLQVMNHLQYDVAGPKNTEFYSGIEILHNFVSNASFANVATNLDVSQEPALRDYVSRSFLKTFDAGNEKVAVLSVVPDNFMVNVKPAVTKNLRFERQITAVRAEVASLQRRGVNKIVLLGDPFLSQQLIHDVNGIDACVVPFALYSNNYNNKNNNKNNDKDQEAEDHTLGGEPVLGPSPHLVPSPWEQLSVPVVGPGQNGLVVGYLDLEFDQYGVVRSGGARGDVVLLDNSVEADPEVAAMVTGFYARVLEFEQEILAETTALIEGIDPVCRGKECDMGRLLTDVMREAMEAELALYNGGGIRASFEGGISVGDIHQAFPFSDTVEVVLCTGRVLKLAMENGLADPNGDAFTTSGRFPQISGFEVSYNPNMQPGNRVVTMLYEGEPIQPEQVFRLAVGSYIRYGGDDYFMLLNETIGTTTAASTIAELMQFYVQREKLISPPSNQRLFQTDLVPINGVKSIQFVEADSPAAITSYVFASVGIISCLLVGAVMYRYRQEQVVKLNSPVFIMLILLGILTAYISMFIWGGEPNDGRCISAPLLAITSVALIYACLLAKSFHVFRLMKNPLDQPGALRLKRRDLFISVLLVLSIFWIFYIIWAAVDPLEPRLVDDNFSNSQVTLRCACSHQLAWEIVLLCMLAVLMLAAALLSFRTRKLDLPSVVNESAWIGWSVYSNVLFVALTCIFAIALVGAPIASYVGLVLGIFVCASTVLALLFFPKIYVLYLQRERRRTHWSAMSASGTSDGSFSSPMSLSDTMDSPLLEEDALGRDLDR